MASIQRYSAGGRTYWRIVESYREKGRPKLRLVKHLGTADDLLAVLQGDELTSSVRSVSHGDVASLLALADELGVVSLVDDEIAARAAGPPQPRHGLTVGQTCLLIALGRACQPISKRGWYRWARDTSLAEMLGVQPEKLTSQFFWDQMHEVPEAALPRIEQRLTARVLELTRVPLDLLLYDTTNFFTFIASTNAKPKLPQRGHNKQKRHDLRQVGLALLVSRIGQLPLWHLLYQGNRPDAAHFPTVLTALRERIAQLADAVTDVTVVYDRGNNASCRNQALVDSSELHYVAALTPAHHRALIAEANAGLVPVEVRPGEEVKSWRDRRVIWGAERTVVVYVSTQLRDGQIRGLRQHLGPRARKLDELAATLAKAHSKRRSREQLEREVDRILHGQYIRQVLRVELDERAPGRYTLTWRIDAEAYEDLVEHHLGRRILITDRHDWSTAEILRAYRGQSDVEAAFENLNDPFHLAVRPQYHWTDQKIAVHAWCCVLGYLLVRLLHMRLVERIGYAGSLHTMMDDLGQIRRATVLRRRPGKPGRPRIETVLDYPDDPHLRDLIGALGLRP